MDSDRIKKFLFDRVRQNIIQGKVTGYSYLPSDSDIEKEIDRILNASQNGIIGTMNTIPMKSVSNIDDYKENFLTIKDNIEYLLGEIYNGLNEIIDIVNDSVLEKNQVLRDLKMIDRDFSDIEAGTLHNDGLKYVISDTFADTDKVDMLRTTAQLNLNAGNVVLNNLNASYLGFPHYKNQGMINFTITEGFSKIVSQVQTPGTFFGNIFNGDDTDRWENVITTSTPTTVEGYFVLKLSEVGAVTAINSIALKLYGTKDVNSNPDIITIHYLNQDPADKNWKVVPGGKVEVTGPEVSLNFPMISTTHIRITWTKFYPDTGRDLDYLFSITELSVQKASTVFESVMVSESLQLQPYQNEQPTVYVAELEAEKKVQPGTSIEFYVAVDEPIPGKVIDSSNNIVGVDSDGAAAFVPNGLDEFGKPENYYSYASQLRSRPYISGSLPYQSWQPKWQRITPIGDTAKLVPDKLFFNISEINNPIHDLYYTNPVLWGDPSYTGPWPVSGYTQPWSSGWPKSSGIVVYGSGTTAAWEGDLNWTAGSDFTNAAPTGFIDVGGYTFTYEKTSNTNVQLYGLDLVNIFPFTLYDFSYTYQVEYFDEAPKSGYIWGENPFSVAGIWWGDAAEYPGWWRPLTPTNSGTYTTVPRMSVPDFSIPVYDASGKAVFTYDPDLGRDIPVQKTFWKIFRWPSNNTPLPNTIKLSNKFTTYRDESYENRNVWKWNYKSTKTADDYLISDIVLNKDVNFFTIKLEDYIVNKSNVRIIPGSIREVKFIGATPESITDFTIEYGKEYYTEEQTIDDGVTKNTYYKVKDSDPSLADAHASIVFSDSVLSSRRHGSSDSIKVSLLLSYEATDNISASWDGYLYVPETAVNDLPKCHATPIVSLQKITVQQMSDTGMVLQNKEVGTASDSEDMSGFTLYPGLNLVRIFVDTDIVQDESIDSSIARWRPDQQNYVYIPNTIFISGTYIDDKEVDALYAKTIIRSTNTFTTSLDLEASDIFVGATVHITYFPETKQNYNNDKITAVVTQIEPGIDSNNNPIYKVSINPSIDAPIYVRQWTFNSFTRNPAFKYGKNVQAQNQVKYMTEVDMNVLLYETAIDDDTRFAILTDVDNSKYLVVKTPKNIQYPEGYRNKLHFQRTYWDYLQNKYITYTTGTEGNQGNNPVVYPTVYEPVGYTVPNNSPNTEPTVHYNNISTYGEEINVFNPASSGFLFWDTAENLQTTYSIEYSLAANSRPCDRVFLMAKLISNDLSISPVLNSYSLIINNNVRGV